MKLLYLLLAVALILNPLGCATSNKPLDEPTVQTEQQEEGVSIGTYFKFIGALCLFGLFSPAAGGETEYIYDVEDIDDYYNPKRKYKVEKEAK